MEDAIRDFLINVAMPAVGTLAVSVLVGLLARLAQQHGLTLTREQEERLREIAQDAIAAAEEHARRVRPSGVMVTGEQKRAIARSNIHREIHESGIDLRDEKIESLIDSQLTHMRPSLQAIAVTPAAGLATKNPIG